jgi:8-oxo-dGTP pyrophosphatase MutT (NUDIX family)
VAAIHKIYKPYIRDLMSLTKSITEEPPFEFPKGRHNALQDKTLLAAALRELKEEAGIDLGNSVELMDEISVTDSYKGTDGVKYQTTYYIVKSPDFFEPEFQYFDYDNCIEEYCISKDMHDGKWIELPLREKPKRDSTPLGERLESLLFRVHAKLCSAQIGI